ncbi:hypothetical protein KQI63_09800 [bacterium]|nr:hypothetical protein [bacterium]
MERNLKKGLQTRKPRGRVGIDISEVERLAENLHLAVRQFSLRVRTWLANRQADQVLRECRSMGGLTGRERFPQGDRR